jgi:hypothetical protein
MRFRTLPEKMQALPLDGRCFPIPWFVAFVSGKPEFRLSDPRKIVEGWQREVCWVCGGRLSAYRAWVIGPASAVEGASPEPPSHLECGRFSATACPFLSNPAARRNRRSLPANYSPGADMIDANTNVTALWITKGRGADLIRTSQGILFKLKPPERIEWFSKGREALNAEASFGLSAAVIELRPHSEREGVASVRDFEQRLRFVESWLPTAP